MMTNLFMTCRVGDRINDCMRYLEVDRLPTSKQTYEIDSFPAMYWTRVANSLFMEIKKGALIALRGRIEVDKERGIYILIEQYECIAMDGKKKLIEGN